jgi:hypothetical protein
MQAPSNFIQAQAKGEFTTKDVRKSRVNEVRSSHFTLGYEESTQF